ncbi:SRPBCC family protein [Streptomyces sp. NPDC018693]|uniref:SRPBCC family protein n=1 Tax=unclassified Streptomyces TaxID=2593676 RepID=UPI0037B44CE7
MAERKATAPAGAGTDRLREELEHYIEARLQLMLDGVGRRMGDSARRLGEAHVPGPQGMATAVAERGRRLREHLPSGADALTSTATRAKDTAAHAKDTAFHAKDTVLHKAKDVTGKRREKGGTDKAPDAAGKGLTIIEDIDVGVPVREAYDQWTQFQDFARFSKGVVGVEQEDDTTTKWHVKIGKASRHWQGVITEQVPDERIAWTSEGDHATTKGVVTFHPLGENLTKVLLVLRYYPKGVVERTGSLVRAQGRRARLDLKLYRTFVMMRGEATGGWRGEIRDGEVVRESEEPEGAEEPKEAEESEEPEDEDEDAYDDEEEEESEEEEPEDRYDDAAYDEEDSDWEEDEDHHSR